MVALSSVELEAPTHTLVGGGTTMPLVAGGRSSGGHKLTPLSYASARPPLAFHWTSSDHQVATIARPFDQVVATIARPFNQVVAIIARPFDQVVVIPWW